MSSARDNAALLRRFRDWWHGDPDSGAVPAGDAPLPEPEADASAAGPTGPMPADAAADAMAGGGGGRDWTPQAIAAVQMVCGAGSSIPGGRRLAKASITRIGLNETMSVVDYGCQLGLFSRVIGQETNAWVDGYEPVGLLAAEAERLTKAARLSKRVTTTHSELLNAPIKARSKDVVVTVEAMHRSPERVAQLHNIAHMLKPGGRLMVIDYFREIEAPSSRAIDSWRMHEVLLHGIPRLSHLRSAMHSVRLGLQASENITASYCGDLRGGLRRLARQLTRHPPESAMHGALLAEVEFWGARLRVLESGDVAVYRVLGTVNHV